ncbi:MAG: hypothetical protein NVS3B9_3860 [Candidatus Doudnabacteria bacterium]
MKRPLRVLIVDEDPGMTEVIFVNLNTLGEEPFGHDNAVEAIVEMEHRKFDLLITDYDFPCKNGNDIAELFLQKNPDGKCIGMTGTDPNPFKDRLFVKVFKKPFPTIEMLCLVAEIKDRL